jgi:hypothetical protein
VTQSFLTGTNESAAAVPTARQPVVVQGKIEPLSHVPFHHDGPLTRWLMASAALHPALNCHIAVHEFTDVEPATRAYCDPHVHEFDELNVFFTTSSLKVAVLLGSETVEIEAPATVFIPAGTPHAANVIAGTGTLTAVLFNGTFRAVGAKA